MIREKVKELLVTLPEGVELVGAAKGRSPDEILEALEGGLKIIGENYIQEAESAFKVIGRRAKWHFIGHLQKNKVRKAVKIFDMIETVDSQELAEAINRASGELKKVTPILIEINSGRESQKFGVVPEEAEGLIRRISNLENIRIEGLMTMAPFSGRADDFRPYFKKTKQIFEEIKALGLLQLRMRYLSMGMTNSYKVAIEEGANIVRIGNKIFGNKFSNSD